MKKKLLGFDIVVANKYDDDDFIMYAVVAKNKKQAKMLAVREKEHDSLGATRKRKYSATIEDGPYLLDERDLKEKIGVQDIIGGDY